MQVLAIAIVAVVSMAVLVSVVLWRVSAFARPFFKLLDSFAGQMLAINQAELARMKMVLDQESLDVRLFEARAKAEASVKPEPEMEMLFRGVLGNQADDMEDEHGMTAVSGGRHGNAV